MSAEFYIPLLCAIGLAAAAGPLGRRGAPRLAAATLVAVALTVAVAADIALGVLVSARLLDAAPLAELLGWHAKRPGRIPVPVPISVTAGAALALIAAAAWRDWRRSRAAWQQLHAAGGPVAPGELIVVRSADAVAYAVPARRDRPGRIVVSDGMLRTLDPGERRVLLAHERSHLRHRHDRYRRLIRIAARINPLLRPAVEAADLLTERWADEDAARAVGSRRLTARALARAALANADRSPHLARASFAAHRVSARVTALLRTTPSRGGGVALLLAAALGAVAALGAAIATHDLAHLFDLLRGDG